MAGVSGTFAFRAPLADHAQHPVAGILAEVGDVGGAGLIDAQGVVQQQPHHRRGAQHLELYPWVIIAPTRGRNMRSLRAWGQRDQVIIAPTRGRNMVMSMSFAASTA